MTTIENKTLSGGYWSQRRSALPADQQNSAQSLRPTFEGWGPRL